jgi:hypothetical protein
MRPISALVSRIVIEANFWNFLYCHLIEISTPMLFICNSDKKPKVSKNARKLHPSLSFQRQNPVQSLLLEV